jgi:hypothetical protein
LLHRMRLRFEPLQSAAVVVWRVEVTTQTWIIKFTQGDRIASQKFLERAATGSSESQEYLPGHHDWMPRVARQRRLTNIIGMSARKLQQAGQSLQAQLRLVAQYKHPMCEAGVPASPGGRALHRAEHAAFGSWIAHSILKGEPQPVKFCAKRTVTECVNDC